MTHMYELSNSVIGLRNMLDDESIDDQTFADTLESIEGEIEIKAENLLKFEREVLADVSAIDAEIKRLTKIKNVRKNRADSLREYLRSNMERSEIDKIACPFFAITLRKATKILIVDDEAVIAPRFFDKIPASKKLNRKRALDALKAGKKVAGCSLGSSKRSLLVK